MSAAIRVVIADDHPLVLCGCQAALSGRPDIALLGQALDSTGLVDMLRRVCCDVLLTDLAMPGGLYGDGLPMVSYVRRHFPEVNLVVQTMLGNPALIWQLLDLGVRGVFSKADGPAHLVEAVLAAGRNGRYLSPSVAALFHGGEPGLHSGAMNLLPSRRETEVIRLFVSGCTVKEIAERLHRSIKTISTQKACAMQKLGCRTDAELFAYAHASGLLNLPGGTPAAAARGQRHPAPEA